MESQLIKRNRIRKRRVFRVRKRVKGMVGRPRLCAIKTNSHIHVQLIDDQVGQTVASISTISKDFRGTEFNRKNKASAHQLGLRIAELAKGKGISKIIFDRGRAKYHGVMAALADGAREGGLEF